MVSIQFKGYTLGMSPILILTPWRLLRVRLDSASPQDSSLVLLRRFVCELRFVRHLGFRSGCSCQHCQLFNLENPVYGVELLV